MRVLISGFGPFGEHTVNPTSLIIHAINSREIHYSDELNLKTLVLPVTFKDSFELMKEMTTAFNPDVIIATGLSASKDCIQLESRALNRIHAPIPDNIGHQPLNKKIDFSGPEFYLSTLPLTGMEGHLNRNNIPVAISHDAGAFVCNYIFYQLMRDNQETARLCGFIHFPQINEYAEGLHSGVSFEDLKKATELLLDYIRY